MDRNAAAGLGDVTPFLESHETGYGYMTHLRPPLWMNETKPHWALPTAPLGSHGPGWVQAELPRR